jgi:hypothetical protein
MALLSLVIGGGTGRTLVFWTGMEGALFTMIALKLVVAAMW